MVDRNLGQNCMQCGRDAWSVLDIIYSNPLENIVVYSDLILLSFVSYN